MPTDITNNYPPLILKSVPPKPVKGFQDRERLRLANFSQGDQITALCAPTGYGKTAQLAQWRRDALTKGSLTFWYTVDEHDEPSMFVRGLSLSARAACGNRGFDDTLVEWIEERTNPREALAGWLAGIANLSVDTMLLIDDLDLFPAESRNQVLTYLLGNAPPNLHIALASRDASMLSAIGAHRPCAINRLTVSDLCFRVEETMVALSTDLEKECTPELGVHIQELTKGWPLGVKLAGASLKRGEGVDSLPSIALSDVQHYFAEAVIQHLPSEQIKFLEQLAQFDLIHSDLCKAVLGIELNSQDLHRFQDEIPILTAVEGGEWMSFHPLAKGVLAKRLSHLPLEERQRISAKAAQWYADKGLYEEASKHALLAGEVKQAISLVESSTFLMTVQGRSRAVLSWFERMSPEERHKHPGFFAPAAWALAMSDRHAEAAPLINLILAQPDIDDFTRFDTALIRSAAAGFSDHVELIESSLESWPFPFSGGRPGTAPVHATGRSFVALFNGQPELARNYLTRIEDTSDLDSYSPVATGFSAYGVGLSYLWEGRFALAEQTLRPALARAEKEMGRRNPVTCSLAALLAQACWELGLDDDPRILLADRISIIERLCLPDTLIATYKTLSRLSDHMGRQDHALALLESLETIGKQRAIPRLQVLARYELICLHARHERIDTAKTQCEQLMALVKDSRETIAESTYKWLRLHAHLAQGHVSIAQDQRSSAAETVTTVQIAMNIAKSLKRTSDLVDAQLLKAELLFRMNDASAQALKDEALSLAEAEQMVRLLRQHGQGADKIPRDKAPTAAHESEPPPSTAHVNASALLTPKEREVLILLGRNFSNKEIARAMDNSVETVKWHIKNLFSKLNAGSRKHVVARARMLGVLSEEFDIF